MQLITLGVPGNEQVLPAIGRSLTATGNDTLVTQGQAADGTLHTDFIKRRRSWTLTYSALTEATKQLIDEIYSIQVLSGEYCRFTFTDGSGQTMSHTVILDAPSYGTLLPRGDQYFYLGVTLTMTEV